MITGALVLPRLRKMIASADPSGPPRARRRAAGEDAEPETAQQVDGDVERPRGHAADDQPEGSTMSRRLAQVGTVTDWAPLVGALPASPDTGPAPVLFGLTGHWK
jgi:hypothetical protein